MAHQRKSTIQAIFLHSKQQKPYQGTLRTQEPTRIGSETSLGPSMDPTGPLKQMVPDPIIFKPISGQVYHFYSAPYLLAPPIILEHFFGHCGTLSGLKGPSWTFMDPKMDPKMDPARQISGDPWQKRALQGPFRVQSDQFFQIDLKTTDKLKFTAWFEVNPTFGSGDIRFLKPGGPFGPPPRLIRVKV